jgi:hypothetical protein
MNKKIRRPARNSQSTNSPGLPLVRETIRTLTTRDLSQVLSGCDTTSVTTELPHK